MFQGKKNLLLRIVKFLSVVLVATMLSGYMVLMPSISNNVYADTDETLEIISDVAASTALPNFDPDTSGDGVVGFVNRLYRIGLTREGEEAGVNFFVATLVGHYVSGGTVAQQILTSPEFQSHNYSNEDFVEILYRVFFNRNSDEAGRNYWIMAMSYGGTRNDVIFAFIQAYEWQEVCSNYGIDSGATNVVVTPAPTATNTPCPTATSTPCPTTTLEMNSVFGVPTLSVDPLFAMPYISTYYFNPKPAVGETIVIPLYFTDYNQSEYLDNESGITMDLIYEVDGVSHRINNLPLGDYNLTLGTLSEGKHIFSVQVLDTRTGVKSQKLYNDLWVVNPTTYEISEAQTYYMTAADLTNYAIHNDNSTNSNDCITTRDGLNNLFADVKAAGFRKIVLLPGVYRINGVSGCLNMPSEFTIDLNGSTIKLDTVTSTNERVSACIIRFRECIDSHLINGTLEGDRFERQALGLETGYVGEMIMTVVMEGDKYCSLDNLTIQNTTGHTVGCGCVWGPRLMLTSFSRTAIINGNEVSNSNCSTSNMVDLTSIINWDSNEDYIYVGHPEGYRGIMGDSQYIYVTFYDANQNLMCTVEGQQYRKLAIPSGAKYARVTLLGTNIATSGYDGTVSIYTKHFENYSEIVNVDFIDTRTTCMAPSAAISLLIENCTYTRCANSITPLCVDFEDGAQECQDMYYRNNTVLEPGEGTTCTVVSCFGYNHVIEDNVNHSVEIRAKVVGGVVRNMDASSVAWYLGDNIHSGYGRFVDSTSSNIRILSGAGENCVRFAIKNCNINGSWVQSLPYNVMFDNCNFSTLSGASGLYRNCTIYSVGTLGTQMKFFDCTFVGGETSRTYITLTSDGDSTSSRLFENCNFVGQTGLSGKIAFHSGVFRNCVFDDVMICASTDNQRSEIIFEECTINSTASEFIKIGPFAYSANYINISFRNCTITHTGNTFIYMYSKPIDNSQILFENCIVNKDNGCLISWESGNNLTNFINSISVDVIFRSTSVNQNLPVQQIDTNNFRVIYE